MADDNVKIPVRIAYDGRGWDALSKDARKAEREALRATQQQIAQQRRLSSLTRGLDKDLGPAKPGLAQQIGGQFMGAEVLQSALGGIKDFTAGAVMLDAQAKSTERAFISLSGGAAQADKNLQAMDEATRNLMTDTQEMAIANQLMALGIAKSDEEMSRFVSGARRLGAIKGLGASEAIENLGAAVTNLSYVRLDQMGISASKVRDRVNELKDAGMGVEEAFKTAVLEQMDVTLKRLGPEMETNADKVQRLSAEWTNFQTAFGGAITSMSSGTGALDAVTGFVERMASGAKAWEGIGQNAQLLQRGMEILNEEGETTLGWLEEIPIIGSQIQGLDFWGSLITRSDDLGAAMTKAGQEADALTAALENNTPAVEDNAAASEEDAKAKEKAARALEKLQNDQRAGVKNLISTLADYEEQGGEIWDQWSDDVSELNQTTFKRIEDIQASSADRQKKIQKDLTKELKKIDLDTGKELEKAKKDITKRDTRASEDAARQERQTLQQSKIETLGDERLFQFEMRQLAAEGQGNAIKAALERRAIEQEIEAEKATATAQASDEEAQVQATRQQEDDAEQLQAIRDQAEQQRAVARESAAQDELLRQEELQKAIDDENLAYDERLSELQNYREEKLTELDESKAEAIETLGAELSQMEGMTTEALAKLAEVAGKYGKDVGSNFSAGIEQGLAENETVNSLLGLTTPETTATAAEQNVQAGRIAHNLPQFASGGEFTVGGSGGVDSQLVQFMASPGEKVTVSQPGQVVLNVNGPGQDQFAAYLLGKVEIAIKDYHQGVIVPWAQGK